MWELLKWPKTLTMKQFSHSVVSDSLRPHESQHTRHPCPSQTPGVYSNSCPLSLYSISTIGSDEDYRCFIPLFPSVYNMKVRKRYRQHQRLSKVGYFPRQFICLAFGALETAHIFVNFMLSSVTPLTKPVV